MEFEAMMKENNGAVIPMINNSPLQINGQGSGEKNTPEPTLENVRRVEKKRKNGVDVFLLTL